MSKKLLQKKPLRKFNEEEILNKNHLTFNQGILSEKSINVDRNINKEDTYSIGNLKQDWDSIKVLQNDIKRTSDKLKQLGSLHSRPLSECGKIVKHEKKPKNNNIEGKELKKLQDKYKELSTIVKKYEKER